MEYNNLVLQLRKICLQRLEHYLQKQRDELNNASFAVLGKGNTPFSKFAKKHTLSNDEKLILAVALAPHLDPDFYTNIIDQVKPEGGDIAIFGGIKGKNTHGILPTGETVMFLIGGANKQSRHKVERLLNESKLFVREMLFLANVENGEPKMSGRLGISDDVAEILLAGRESPPEFGEGFPVQKLETTAEWAGLVLPEKVMSQIEEIKTWVEFNSGTRKVKKPNKESKPGYLALFHGPSGTGKALTAALLGKYAERLVYRISVAAVVSKYIGETEKNLAKLFRKAESMDCILFFDEADALFGKRTQVKDAHDRYANQEVSYLFSKMEKFNGLIIVSTRKANLDEAFIRRFNSVIDFPFPDAAMREKLWATAFPKHVKLDKQVDLKQVASKHKLTGRGIVNAVHKALSKTADDKNEEVSMDSILLGISHEEED